MNKKWIKKWNLIGFIPYVFSVTTHLIIALGLSLSIWLSCVILALEKHQINFFSAFMPAGTPMVLAILLVPIEILSFTARALSLGFRLCINVSSGHRVGVGQDLWALFMFFVFNIQIEKCFATIWSLNSKI